MKKLKEFLDFIKVEHTIFALPFVYIGAILGIEYVNLNFTVQEIFLKFFLITIAAFTARSSAMALNRIIDRKIDAKNPRTKNRHLPTKKISLNEAYIFTLLSITIFLISSYLLNFLCFLLSPIPLIIFFIYPYLKRYTAFSHLFLGLCLGIAPLGGFIAITGNFENLFFPLIISFFVIFWVAGFDIIYAIQDFEIDRKMNLHSIPSKFGIKKALKISIIFHLIALIFIFLFLIYKFSYIILAGFIGIMMLLFYEHLIVKNFGEKVDEKKINTAFFNVNGIVSFLFFVFILIDFIVKI